MTQSKIYSVIEQKQISPMEQIISVAQNLFFSFLVVPHALPTENYMTGLDSLMQKSGMVLWR